MPVLLQYNNHIHIRPASTALIAPVCGDAIGHVVYAVIKFHYGSLQCICRRAVAWRSLESNIRLSFLFSSWTISPYYQDT